MWRVYLIGVSLFLWSGMRARFEREESVAGQVGVRSVIIWQIFTPLELMEGCGSCCWFCCLWVVVVGVG